MTNLSAKRKIKIFAYLKVFLGIISIVILAQGIRLLNVGWPLALTLANLPALAVIRLLPYDSIIGIDDLNKHWKNRKSRKFKFLLPDATCEKLNSDLIVTASHDNVSKIDSAFNKTVFLVNDTEAFIKTFRNDLAYLIATNALGLFIILFNDDLNGSSMVANPQWPKEAIDWLQVLKEKLALGTALAAISIQLALVLKVPFLLDIRTKTFLSELKKS